jgi:DNA-binding NarL/FixJ family response regulator
LPMSLRNVSANVVSQELANNPRRFRLATEGRLRALGGSSVLETNVAGRHTNGATRTHSTVLAPWAHPHSSRTAAAAGASAAPPQATGTPPAPAPTQWSRAGHSRSEPRRPGAPTEPLTVAVLAGDPVTGEGAVACLRTQPGISVLTADRLAEAEVVLILVGRVTEETLDLMQRTAETSNHDDLRFVLVGDGVREHQLLRSLTYGLVSFIPRQEADFAKIVRAIAGMRHGKLELPAVASGWLAERIRAIQRDVLEPKGLNAIGLETREVEVLRLLAEGLGTPEIAQRLSYSERTVKNIIHGILTRLKLRNRAHAVAFALRTGTL